MFSRIFIERPRLAIVVSVVMALAGGLCISRLPIAEYPEIAPPQIQVSAAYTGASSQVVADTVGLPLESEFNGVDDLLYFSSTSDNNGNYSCSITFRSGTDPDMAMVNVQNAVKRAEPSLPSEVTRTGITVDKSTGDVLAMFVFKTDGSNMSILELSNYVSTRVKDTISRIDGVGSVDVMAGKEYAMRIWLDPMRLSGLGVSTAEVIAAVESQNVQAAVGAIGTETSNDQMQFKVNVQGRLVSAGEFGDIVVRADGDGRTLRLRDIARVELGADSYSGQVSFNGEECTGLGVYRNSDANALATITLVKAELEELAKRFPPGVSYAVALDLTEFIVISLREIVETLAMALLLVVAITFLFLQDWRATLIPSVAIPVALLATFPVMWALGYSINVLTMFGLILVIGSLVDDAIVVVENTMALMEREGLSARDAALKSMEQITGAVIATTLVTVACYVPLAFYGGMVGTIYMQFAVTMCVALCFSTVVALTLSPALCSLLLRPPSADGGSRWFRPLNAALDGSKRIYLAGVGVLVRRGLLTAGLFATALAGLYFLYGRLPSSFLPEEDKGMIMANIQLSEGATLARTQAALDVFRERVMAVPGVSTCMTVAGMSMLTGQTEHGAMGIVQFDAWDKRKTPELSIGALKNALREATEDIAAADIMFFTPPAIMGLGMSGGASFYLSADADIDAVDLSVRAKDFARTVGGRPEAMFATSLYNADTPQLQLDLDREKAETLGVPASRVFSTLQGELASFYINDFNYLGNAFTVIMQSSGEHRVTAADILDIQVPNNAGDMVPLSSLATLRRIVGPRQIQRFNKMTSAELSVQAAPGVGTGVLMAAVENTPTPEGLHIEWTGMSYQERENRGQIVALMALAMVFAYLFLVAQYESWTVPVSVMLSVAFACLGALMGLLLAGLDLSIYAQLGLVMLIGLAAKNAILMVEFSKQERERGLPVAEAAMNGASLRYRAVLMTAWSFLCGVLPLVMASGAGAASRRAIGVTTFSGMLAATFVGIVFTPALYALCQRLREAVKRRLGMANQ